MGNYEFRTSWLIDSEVDPVWAAIADFERWPSWWTSVQRLRAAGDTSFDIAWRSALPYELGFRMRVTRSEPPHLLEGATEGELSGTGVCRLAAVGEDSTRVSFDWKVSTTRAWMKALAPVARPVFVWNHDHVMHAGGEGIGRLLDTRVSW